MLPPRFSSFIHAITTDFSVTSLITEQSMLFFSLPPASLRATFLCLRRRRLFFFIYISLFSSAR